MTDILDLEGWSVIAKRLDEDECVIEAEYAVPPKACTKCGNIGNLYKHGPKPLYIRDSPIRGRPVRILANAQRFKCRECGGVYEGTDLYLTRMGPLFDDEPETNLVVMCGYCKVRFHTEHASEHSSPSTP